MNYLKKISILIILSIFLVCLLNIGVSAEKEPIRIGVCLTLSTIQPMLAQEQKKGFECAVDFIGGEINGHPIELYVADVTTLDNCRAETEKLIENVGCKIMIGPGAGVMDQMMAQLCERKKVIMWQDLIGGIELQKQGYKYVFRINDPGDQEGKDQARWLTEDLFPVIQKNLGNITLEDLKVGVINNDTEWGTDISDAAIETLEDYGVQVVLHNTYNEDQVRDMTPVVFKMKSLGVNAVLASGMWPLTGKLFWEAAKTLDFNPWVAIGTGGFIGTGAFVETFGEKLVEGFCSTNWPVELTNPKLAPGIQKFMEIYSSKYNREHVQTCHSISAYTATLILWDVLSRMPEWTDEDFSDKFVKVALETDIPVGKLGNGWGCKFSTPEEPWNGLTNQNISQFNVGVQWQKGQMYTMWPMPYEGIKYELPMPTWKEKEK